MEDSWNFLKLLLQCKTCANVLAFGFGDRFAKFKPDSQIENRFAEKPDLSPTASTNTCVRVQCTCICELKYAV